MYLVTYFWTGYERMRLSITILATSKITIKGRDYFTVVNALHEERLWLDLLELLVPGAIEGRSHWPTL